MTPLRNPTTGLPTLPDEGDDCMTPQQARARFERKSPKAIWPLALALSMSGGLLLMVASFVGGW